MHCLGAKISLAFRVDWGEKLRNREVTVLNVMHATGKNKQSIRSWKRNLAINRDSLATMHREAQEYTQMRGKNSTRKRRVTIGAGLRNELPKLVQDAHIT